MEAQDPIRGRRVDCLSLVAHRGRDPGCFERDLIVLDVRLAPGRVGENKPHERRPDHEPNDEQPPVEFAVHRWARGAPTRGETIEGGRFIRRPV